MLSTAELQQLVEEISESIFHKPFLHQAMYNKRLRTTGGRYMLGDHSIQINPLVLELHGLEELVGVIKHELCHYHLHLEGRGYRHIDQDFKKLLKTTNSPRYCKPLVIQRKSTLLHRYQCTSCTLQYEKKRRMDVKKYRCGQCKGRIVLKESIRI